MRQLSNVFDAIAKRFYISGWFTTRAWLQAHRDLANRYAKVMYETARWANAHQNESATILARYSKVSAETARQMVRATYAETLDANWLQPPLDLAASAGVTTRRVLASELMPKI